MRWAVTTRRRPRGRRSACRAAPGRSPGAAGSGAGAPVEGKRGAEAQAVIQELLGATLAPAVRAWVLLLNGEASRIQGNFDDARTQYDLAQRTEPVSATGWFAGLRQAQVNFELREFAQAARDLGGLVATAPSSEARATVLLLQGEAAYHAGNYAVAGAPLPPAALQVPHHPHTAAARRSGAPAAPPPERNHDPRPAVLQVARGPPHN